MNNYKKKFMKRGMALKHLHHNGDEDFYRIDHIYPLELIDFDSEVCSLKFSGAKFNFMGVKSVIESECWSVDIKPKLNKNSFILSTGGWLPPTYCIDRRYLLDRNIISYIETKDSVFLDWFSVMRSASNNFQFSTVFSAIEKSGEFPDLISFKDHMNTEANTLAGYFNDCQILSLNDDAIKNIYVFIKNLRQENLTNFLIQALNIIKTTKSESDRREYAEQIIKIAKDNKLNRSIHLVILCLSSLYSKNNDFARKIIKPTKIIKNKSKQTKNTINDTIFIDLILLMKKYVDKNFSGITCDKGLAQYWCALNPRIDEESCNFSYSYDISNQLFSSASQADLDFLRQSIAELQHAEVHCA